MTNKILVAIAFFTLLGCAGFAELYSPCDKAAAELLLHPDLVIGASTFEKYYPLALGYLNLPPETNFGEFAAIVDKRRSGFINSRDEAISVLRAPFFIPNSCLKMRLKVIQTALSAGYLDPKYGSSCSATQFALLQNYFYNDSLLSQI